MSEPLVSIVIPTFNGLPYVQQAYESCLNQTYENIEICVSDGGSTDGTVEWIEQLPEDVRKEFLPAGASAAANWTNATQMATGDFIKLLCQDDVLYPEAISSQVEQLATHPSAVMVASQRDIVSATGKVIAKGRGLGKLSSGFHMGATVLDAIYRGGTNILGEPVSVLFQRSALLNAMPWDSERPFLLDLITYTQVLRQPDAVLVAQRLSTGAFRVSMSSWSTRLASSQRSQMRSWQKEFEEANQPSFAARLQARAQLHKQQALRLLAYSWLSLKRDLG